MITAPRTKKAKTDHPNHVTTVADFVPTRDVTFASPLCILMSNEP